MPREMNEQEKQLFDVMRRYEERFGVGQFLPLMQVAPEATKMEFLIKLYERCLAEGKLAREYVEIYNDPDALY